MHGEEERTMHVPILCEARCGRRRRGVLAVLVLLLGALGQGCGAGDESTNELGFVRSG
eukprot:CAMPEP_0114168872 /NCGR_PEP_ID=MMETSP0043_2-20121206/33242_1 /TAXON_ID=464988 /ORGANISM="Hemiselmis andersenii, Strain CCMP644" /LENGTH=57 /DNA_ID=CAMNT_0001266247 /DNA_START=77 /DNA_END=247 /DNA_ORIENTATION=+